MKKKKLKIGDIECYYDNVSIATIYKNVFTNKQLGYFNMYLNQVDKVQSYSQVKGTNKRVYNPDFKQCFMAQINESPITDEILDGIEQCVSYANKHYYKFDLSGAVMGDEYGTRGFVVNEYYKGGYFHKHIGWNPISINNRIKLIAVMQLSEGYEGGEFAMYTGNDSYMPKEIGTLAIMPSFLLHEVKEITRGVRRSLISWVWCQDRFK